MAKSFTVYEEYDKLMIFLTREEKANVVLAIWEYMFSGKKPVLSERESAVFVNLKRPLDKSINQSKRRSQKKPNENQNKTPKEPNLNQKATEKKPNENTSNDVNVSNYYDNNNYFVNGNVNVSNNDINNVSNNIPEDNLTIDDFLQENIYLKIEKELCMQISSGNKIKIDEYLQVFSEDIIFYAATKSTAANVRKLSYVFRILDNWKENKLFTLEKIKESESTSKKSKNKSNLDTFDKVINNESR